MTKRSPFKYFKTSPEIIRLAVMLYVRFPLSLRNVEDLLHGRGIDVSHETIRFWWNRFGPMFASEIRRRRSCVCPGVFSILHFVSSERARLLSPRSTPSRRASLQVGPVYLAM